MARKRRQRCGAPLRGGLALALWLALGGAALPLAHAQSAGSPTCVPQPSAQPIGDPDPSLIVGPGAALGVLNLPNIGIGPELFAEIDAGWPIDVTLAYFPPNSAEIDDHDLDLGLHPLFYVPFPDDGSRIRVSIAQASAAACPLRYRLPSGSLLACGGLFGGVLMADPDGFVAASDETRLLLGADVYARWHFRISRPIGITYSAGLFVPFMRDRFGYRDRKGAYRELFQIAPLGGRLDVALVWWFE